MQLLSRAIGSRGDINFDKTLQRSWACDFTVGNSARNSVPDPRLGPKRLCVLLLLEELAWAELLEGCEKFKAKSSAVQLTASTTPEEL